MHILDHERNMCFARTGGGCRRLSFEVGVWEHDPEPFHAGFPYGSSCGSLLCRADGGSEFVLEMGDSLGSFVAGRDSGLSSHGSSSSTRSGSNVLKLNDEDAASLDLEPAGLMREPWCMVLDSSMALCRRKWWRSSDGRVSVGVWECDAGRIRTLFGWRGRAHPCHRRNDGLRCRQ
jgi:hypothetical protein